jgi:hypothetical protein
MSLNLAQVQSPRQTTVDLFDRDESGNEFPIHLNIQHHRLTSVKINEILGEKIQARLESMVFDMAERIQERLETEKEKEKILTQEKVREIVSEEKIKLPRNVLVVHLARLLTFTDIITGYGKPDTKEDPIFLPPTEEGLEQVPTNILQAIYDRIYETIVPQKKSLENSPDGTSAEVGAAASQSKT